jgi:hypothetical protein
VAAPFNQPHIEPGVEYWLTVSYRLRDDAPWAPAGHEVAWDQFALPWRAASVRRPAPNATLELSEIAGATVVESADWRLRFDHASGAIASWAVADQDLLVDGQGPRATLWRAPTDNDDPPNRGDNTVAGRWRAAGLDRLRRTLQEFEAGRERGAVRVRATYTLKAPDCEPYFNVEETYAIEGDGDVVLTTRFEPHGELPQLPRIGHVMVLAPPFDRLSWYGRGPHETYADRQDGARVGLWSGTVREQYFPYILPQEHGNKTGVRWVALANEAGAGLMALAEPGTAGRWLEASAHHYSAADLGAARHTHELVWRDEVYLSLDYAQSGLGNGSCGPGVLPPYQVTPEPATWSVRFRPFSQTPPMGLMRVAR